MVRTRTCTEAKVPRRMAWRVMIPNQVSIWFSQLDPVGVKWKGTFGFAASHALTSGVVWVDRLSRTTWISRPACGATAFFRKARNAGPLRLRVESPTTSPGPALGGGKQVGGP